MDKKKQDRQGYSWKIVAKIECIYYFWECCLYRKRPLWCIINIYWLRIWKCILCNSRCDDVGYYANFPTASINAWCMYYHSVHQVSMRNFILAIAKYGTNSLQKNTAENMICDECGICRLINLFHQLGCHLPPHLYFVVWFHNSLIHWKATFCPK